MEPKKSARKWPSARAFDGYPPPPVLRGVPPNKGTVENGEVVPPTPRGSTQEPAKDKVPLREGYVPAPPAKRAPVQPPPKKK